MDYNIKMKDTFLSTDKETALKMLNYLQSIGMDYAELYDFIGYKVIEVPEEEYVNALEKGRQFARNEDFGISWISCYGERRSPISSTDIGFCVLPQLFIKGESVDNYNDRFLWSDDQYTPRPLVEYLDDMKNYLGVDEILRSHHRFREFPYEGLRLSSLSINHEEQVRLLEEFVTKYGLGPFTEIHSMTTTGEYNKKPLQLKRH